MNASCDWLTGADCELVGMALTARNLHDDPGLVADASAGVTPAAAADVCLAVTGV